MKKLKLKNSSLFWLLQLLGWGALGSSQVFLKATVFDDVSMHYVIAEGVIIIVSGIFFSSVMRLIYIKKISIEDFNFRSLFWVLGIILLTTLALAAFEFVVANAIYWYLHKEQMQYSALANIVNTFIMLVLWSILYFSIKAMIKSQKEKVERLQLESNLKESQLNTLKGQINPHFMFNSLNNIRGLMLEDVTKSREMITKLSELLRYSLNSDKVDKIAIEEELETVRNYVELSKIQLEDRLQYKEELSEEVTNIMIPPMLIQMLVENAIKHGVANQVKGGTVVLKLYTKISDLYIEVINDGRLNNKNSSTKIGLANISERLRILYGSKSSFSLQEEAEKVVARIKIPLEDI